MMPFSPEPPHHELERTAHLALVIAARSNPAYTSRFSRKEFTQPQLMAVLILKDLFGHTYRGITKLLQASDLLRHTLGPKKVPHRTTLEATANARRLPGRPSTRPAWRRGCASRLRGQSGVQAHRGKLVYLPASPPLCHQGDRHSVPG